jgi:hypothetical protein
MAEVVNPEDPIRLVVLKRLSNLLGTTNYTHIDSQDRTQNKVTPMAGRVYRGRGIFGNETDTPFISILEAPIPAETNMAPRGGSDVTGDWELVVQGFVQDDKYNPTDPAHPLLAQVKKVLALERRKQDWDDPSEGILGLGQTVDNLYIGSGVVRPADELSATAYFWLTLTVTMIEDLTDPNGR